MNEFDFVKALKELQETNPEGYELVVETIHRLSEKQKTRENVEHDIFLENK